MIRHLAGAALAAVLAATSLQAADSRLTSRVYNPDEVVRIEGKLNVQATIAFGEGEQIENVAVGDSDSWQITPNKRADLLFVKPLGENARTNMTVVTDRHTYFFDLVATPAAKPVYALRFTYAEPAAAPPVEPAKTPSPSAPVTRPALAEKPAPSQPPVIAARGKPAPTAKPAATPANPIRIEPELLAEGDAAGELARLETARREVLGEALSAPEPAVPARIQPAARQAETAKSPWAMRGQTRLLPAAVRDDGEVTYLDWPAAVILPDILDGGTEGEERPLAYSREGETVVIAAVPRRIVLRSGEETAWLDRSGKLNRKKDRAAAKDPS